MAGKPVKISFDESGNTVIVEGCIIDYVVKAVASFQQIEHEPLVLPDDFFFTHTEMAKCTCCTVVANRRRLSQQGITGAGYLANFIGGHGRE